MSIVSVAHSYLLEQTLGEDLNHNCEPEEKLEVKPIYSKMLLHTRNITSQTGREASPAL